MTNGNTIIPLEMRLHIEVGRMAAEVRRLLDDRNAALREMFALQIENLLPEERLRDLFQEELRSAAEREARAYLRTLAESMARELTENMFGVEKGRGVQR